MNNRLHTLDISHVNALTPQAIKQAVTALESGQVIHLPHYSYRPDNTETALLTESILHPKHKNISYDYGKKLLAGLGPTASPELSSLMSSFMHRFAEYSQQLISSVIPRYKNDLIFGKTSYRPAEVQNRKISKRKDDTRVHVDAFPSTPVYGRRILRVFCNINPNNTPRIWELGEPFNQVLNRFSSKISSYNALRARVLVWLKASKTIRSPYDHFMLKLHDQMKLDDHYQQTLIKQRIDFPAQSTWVVFTDHVSHAALGGQYLLEQTFYLPITAMERPELSPFKQWESLAL